MTSSPVHQARISAVGAETILVFDSLDDSGELKPVAAVSLNPENLRQVMRLLADRANALTGPRIVAPGAVS